MIRSINADNCTGDLPMTIRNSRLPKRIMLALAAIFIIWLALFYGWNYYKKEALKDAVEPRVLSLNANLNHLVSNPDRITYGEFFLEIPKAVERIDSDRIALEAVNDSALPGLRNASVNYATRVRSAVVALRDHTASTVRANLANDALLSFQKRGDFEHIQSLAAGDPQLLRRVAEQNMAKIEAEPDPSRKIKLLQDGAALATAMTAVSSFNAVKQSAEKAKTDQADKLRLLIQAGDELFLAGSVLDSSTGRSLGVGRLSLKPHL
jgi:hypothetical protein